MRKMIVSVGVAMVAGVVLAAGGGCAHGGARAEDDHRAQKLTAGELPAAVARTAQARFPGHQLISAERETEKTGVLYDLEMRQQGRKYEMDVREDGTVVEVEKEVPISDVPQAVMRAVKAKYPKATIKEVMEVDPVKDGKETPDHYEVTLTDGGREREVEVSLDGTKVTEEAADEK
jgi:uncharacterized membrane protein YkoI